jgi:YHS domain-containing protein
MIDLRIAATLAASILVTACGAAPPAAPSAPSAPNAPAVPGAPATAAAKPALKAPGEAGVGDRTSCPVSGEEFVVTASSPKVEYQGKTYYFCCGGCDGKFQANPQKYLSKPKS